jgi:histidyl-tRNA synthetase
MTPWETPNGNFDESGLSSEDSQQYREVISTIDLLKEMRDLYDKLPEKVFDFQVKINQLESLASALKEKDTAEKKPVIELADKRGELAEIKDSLAEQIKQKRDEQEDVEVAIRKVGRQIEQIKDEIQSSLTDKPIDSPNDQST